MIRTFETVKEAYQFMRTNVQSLSQLKTKNKVFSERESFESEMKQVIETIKKENKPVTIDCII